MSGAGAGHEPACLPCSCCLADRSSPPACSPPLLHRSWSKLVVTVTDVKGNERQILKNVDGYIEPNHMLVGDSCERFTSGWWKDACHASKQDVSSNDALPVSVTVRGLPPLPLPPPPILPSAGDHGPIRMRQDNATG